MLGKLLVENGVLKKERFVLSHGDDSTYYFDVKSICADPKLLARIVDEISPKVKAGAVAGMELGAVPLVVATSQRLSVPYIILRKGGRDHGLGSRFIGNLQGVKRADIVEDVVTTGRSVVESATLLREHGISVDRAISVIDREAGGRELLEENGIALVSLLMAHDLLRA